MHMKRNSFQDASIITLFSDYKNDHVAGKPVIGFYYQVWFNIPCSATVTNWNLEILPVASVAIKLYK